MARYNIFFGTYSKGAGNGLFRGEFNEDNGEINIKDTIDIENPSYLNLLNLNSDLNENILYGVSEVNSFEEENGGALFSVDISNPDKMRLIDMKCTHGKSPCHLCINENFIYISNYSEGSLSVFESDKSGDIKSSLKSIQHFGKSVNQSRQKESHIHFAAVTPDNKYLAVCDLGMDKVFLYPYSNENGISLNAEIIDCPKGAGPRHLVFSKDAEYLYVVTELQNTVLVYKYNGGKVEFLQEISTLPNDFTGRTSCAAIHISPDGKLLGASNRGHNSVALYKIQDDGKLVLQSHLMTGKEPRDFRFSPNGKMIISSNQNEDTITVYKSENENDNDNENFINFIQTGSVNIPKPVCILLGGEIL